MKTIQLCFLWHMHQPYYTDPVTGSASMPWVRLHATKAYYDMAFLFDKFPQARSTFNFTPSLLLQLEEFSTGRPRTSLRRKRRFSSAIFFRRTGPPWCGLFPVTRNCW